MVETVLAATPGRESAVSHEKRMPHIQALDGVRGLAITLVLLVHLLWSSNRPTGSFFIDLLLKVKNAGWIGVDLFFALSGFLITGILFDSLTGKHYFRNFYMRRALRIFPLYYGVLFVLFLVFRPTWNTGRQLYVLLFYLQNTSLWWHGSQVAAIKDITGHLWSLAVEEQFYLVWPVIVFLVRDRRKLLWVALALAFTAPVTRMILLAHGANFEATYKLTICRSDALLAGGWLALAIRGKHRESILRAAAPVFGLAVVACLIIAWKTGSFNWEDNRLINGLGYSILALASTSLIAMALVPGSRTASIMNWSVLRWLGKYSYGIYIFHQMMGVIYAAFLQTHIHSRGGLHAAILICNLMLTFPLAWLSFRFYERRFLRLKRYFGPA
ncbi:acyltransferase family protein [Edaphobacter albus]|uniref:acyltransferase family protein n=1 Tax=Edaphobacter sp. 4G125 TaxID=2763071 RepID=UPI0016473AF4|nr:acyltransferase [Edaphobacter sp. 4G125]QNI36966.1 acyltransferase [Edaphobacter sp. 4G125]